MTQYEASIYLLNKCFQENCTIQSLENKFESIFPINSITNSNRKIIEISPEIHLNIGNNLQSSQEEKLITLLQKYSKAFSWDYKDMPGILPKTCIHHIYTDNETKSIRQP